MDSVLKNFLFFILQFLYYHQFNIEKVRAKDMWHLANRLIRKILAHTMGVFVNKTLGRPPLQFDGLIKI